MIETDLEIHAKEEFSYFESCWSIPFRCIIPSDIKFEDLVRFPVRVPDTYNRMQILTDGDIRYWVYQRRIRCFLLTIFKVAQKKPCLLRDNLNTDL